MVVVGFLRVDPVDGPGLARLTLLDGNRRRQSVVDPVINNIVAFSMLV